MNINYLYSIINLYVQREKNGTIAHFWIEKKEDMIEFSFNMQNKSQDKTFITLPLDLVLENRIEILNLCKKNRIVLGEEYHDKIYNIMFNNGRIISLIGFTLFEINEWRNDLFGIEIRKEELRVQKDEMVEEKNASQYKLQIAGFTSFINLLVTVVIMSIIFVGALLIFKNIF